MAGQAQTGQSGGLSGADAQSLGRRRRDLSTLNDIQPVPTSFDSSRHLNLAPSAQPLTQAITVPLQQQALAQSLGQTNGKSPQGQDFGSIESLFGQGASIPDFGMGLSSTK